MVKVSVIIPTYNVEIYLKECLDSVIHQTLKDIEIICIDDGSTDNSGKILDEYAQRDSRIKVIHKENGGYGKAMNVGLDNAAGEYVGIVEPDDFVKTNMFEILYNIAQEKKLDFIKSDFYRFVKGRNGEVISQYNHLDKTGAYYNKIINIQKDLVPLNFIMNTWSGIYNRGFLNKYNIRHNETPGASFQDNGFWFQTFIYATKAYFLNQPFYMNRRDNPNSSVKNKGKVMCMKVEYDFIRKILEKDQMLKDRFIYIYQYRRFHNYMFNYNRIDDSLKLEWLRVFANDYRLAYKNNEIDESLFSSKELKILGIIIKNPILFIKQQSRQNSFLENIFSVKNKEFNCRKTKILTILGIKIKLKDINLSELSKDFVEIITMAQTRKAPKISVIVPIYNAQETIKECLNSIFNQTLQDIEVICVNDGSIDNTLEILKQYAQKEPRLTVMNEPNSHAGVARNNGLSYARGEYVHFMDADDTLIEKNVYENLSKLIQKVNTPDIIKFRARAYDYQLQRFVTNNGYEMNKIIYNLDSFVNIKDDFEILSHVSVTPWSGIYKRAFLLKNKLHFNNTKCCNDRFFYISSIVVASNIFLASNIVVKHIINNSKSLRGIRDQYFDSHFSSINNIEDFLKEFNIDIDVYKKIMIFELKDLFYFYNKYLYNSQYSYKIFKSTRKFIRKFDLKELLPEITNQMYYGQIIDLKKNYVVCILEYFKNNYNIKLNKQKHYWQNIFSVKNNSEGKHKIITFLGFKIKFKVKKYQLIKKITELESKITNLEIEIKDAVDKNKKTENEIANLKSWQNNFYKEKPEYFPIRLTFSEQKLLCDYYKNSKFYLEFGAGGSTFLAAMHSDAKIYSVESDQEWLNYLKSYYFINKLVKDEKIKFCHVYIGKTKEWGYPVDDADRNLYPNYSSSVFASIDKDEVDLVFIDGRFRVACVLQTILNCKSSTTIMIHDYTIRAKYHILEEFLDLIEAKDTLAVFKIKKNVDKNRIQEIYEEYKYVKD